MEEIKIQKYFTDCGIMSRRAAESEIERGKVLVNGRPATLGMRIRAGVDLVEYNGRPIVPMVDERICIMLNKPRGFVTTLSDEKGRKNVSSLVSDCGQRVYPVGRLDMDSEGLLILTNDGDFANRLMHPSHEVDKVYRVLVDGYAEPCFKRLTEPMQLDGYEIKTPDVLMLNNDSGRAELQITIHEGKNRQVRRMCAIAGMKVLRLKRIAEGGVQLGELPKGRWRHLTVDEINILK